MNTFQLSCFLAVAQTLHFARAAEQMNISQPAITHQIKSLETELNVQLFRRTTRLVELTPEGRAFLPDAQSIVAIEAQTKLRFSSPKERPIEKLTIGCGSYHQLFRLSESLKLLFQAYPNLHPHLIVVPHEQLFPLLENGTADVVFDIWDGREEKKRLTFKELVKSPIVCVCGADHPMADRESITMQALQDQALIFCNPFSLVPEVTKLQWQLAQGRSPAQMHFCASVEASVILAGAGFGMAVLPEFLVPRDNALSTVPLMDAPLLSFGMYYTPYPGDEVLRRFLQIAKQQLSNSSE